MCLHQHAKGANSGEAQDRKRLETGKQLSYALKELFVDDRAASRQNLNIIAETGEDTT